MSIDVMPSPEALGQTNQPEQPEAKTPQQIIADGLLQASKCVPLTAEEVGLAAQRRERAGSLLAAAVVHRAVTNSGDGLLAYLAHEKAMAGVPAQQRGQKQKDDQDEPPDPRKLAAEGFQAILKTVTDFSDKYDQQYKQPDGRANFSELDRLYEISEPVQILSALPKASACGDETKRTAVIEADRLLRFIIDQVSKNNTQ